MASSLASYATDLSICGRVPVYLQADGYYLCAAPGVGQQLQVSLTPVQGSGCASVQLRDASGVAVTDASDVQPLAAYTLCALSADGGLLSTVPIQFSTLPVLEVTHQGELTRNMTEYVWGSIRLSSAQDPSTVSLQARFRTRGATASEYIEKPSLNMKLRQPLADGSEVETDTTLLGLRCASSWILDAMAIDRIAMRNRVCFDIWNRMAPLPYETQFGSRNGTVGRFVEVVINGQYKGIYCLSDRINRKLLELKKPEVDQATGQVTIRGALYKHGTNSILDQNTPGYFLDHQVYVAEWHDAWELAEPEDYPIAEAWDALNEVYAHQLDYEWVREHFFLPQLAQYQVFITALCIADNWGNKNSFISIRNQHAEGDKHRYIYTPWDLDTSLGGSYNGAHYGTNLYQEWPVELAEPAGGKPHPFHALVGKPEYNQLMRQAWLQASIGALAVDSVHSLMDEYARQFMQSGAWQRQVAHPNGSQLTPDLPDEITYITQWYAERFRQMDRYLGVTDQDRALSVSSPSAVSPDAPVRYFDLQGRPVSSPHRPGIYITTGGRRVVYTH